MRAAATDIGASITLRHRFDGTDPGYPFIVVADVTFALSAGAFTVTVRAENAGAAAAPFFAGWHPYFRIGSGDDGSAAVRLDDRCNWLHVDMPPGAPRGSSLIPTGRLTPFNPGRLNPLGRSTDQPLRSPVTGRPVPVWWDDEFLSRKCAQRHAAGGHEAFTVTQGSRVKKLPRLADEGWLLETRVVSPRSHAAVLFQEGAKFPVVQLFTGAPEAFEASAVACEPQSALADAFNRGDDGARFEILGPGEAWHGSFGVRAEAV